MKNQIYFALTGFVLTLLAVGLQFPLLLTFLFIVITLISGSRLLGDATEELANYYSPTLGGLLNATLGNLAELIIAFFAIKEGLITVVKASLTGSIIGNILLVFGCAVFIGGIKFKEMRLTAHESAMSSTMLLIAAILLLVPSFLFLFNEQQYSSVVSYTAAALLFILYLCSILFSLYTHKEYFLSNSHENPTMKKKTALLLMIGSIIVLVITSELFAARLEAIAHTLAFGELFIGAILVGVVGNAAEHLGVIQFARKNKMSLAFNTAIGSALQVAMFVAPLLVFMSAFLGHTLDLVFLPIEIGAIFLSVILIKEIAQDGMVNWLEGLQLIILYVILAIVFFFYH